MKKVRIPAIIILLLFSTLLIYYFRVIHHYEIIFTHLFYIPIILSAFWWQYRTGYVILYLASSLIFYDLYIADCVMIMHDSIRSLMFLLVGVTTAFLTSERLKLSNLKRYRMIISSMREPVVIVHRDGRIALKNENFSELFPDAVSDISCFKGLMGEPYYSEFIKSFNSCFEKGNFSFSSYIKTAASSTGFFNVNFNAVSADDSSADAVLTFWDMTAQKKTEEMLKTAVERQKLAVDVLDLLNKQWHERDVIKEILNLIKKSTGVDVLGIILCAGGKFLLHEMTGVDDILSEKIHSGCSLINNREVEPGTLCICCRSLEIYNSSEAGTGDDSALLWSNNLEELAAAEGLSMCRCIGDGGFSSSAVIPFSGEDGLLGFFLLFDSAGNFFNDEIIDYYKGVVQSIGIALSRSNYEASLNNTILEKEHLIREVHHRVKNNMQVITSLISLQASRQTDENIRSVLNDCQNRVRAMALVQERLYNSNNFSSINFQNYIETLVPMLMNSYRVDRQRIKIGLDVSDISIGISTAIPLAQLINELLSNSLKHAFKDGGSGNIALSLVRSDSDRSYTLTVSDDGFGFPPDIAFPQNGNLGFQLIDALIKQLRGKYTLSCKNGVSYSINFN